MRTDYENLRVDVEGQIQTIYIDRPSKLNALNKATIEDLSHTLDDAENNQTIRVVILTGEGEKAFVAGADISEFSSFSKKEGEKLSQEGHDCLFNRIEQMGTPVIAAVNGFALGGGLELAMACHLRIFSDSAKVGLPETSLGIIPGYGGTQRLAQITGKGRAMEMILTGEMINAENALSSGLANLVVTKEKLMEEAEAMAKKIIKNSPMAVAKAIQCINANYQTGVNGLEFESRAFGSCFGTEEFSEGTRAFLEKRKAQF